MFKKKVSQSSQEPSADPIVTRIELTKEYNFLYKSFIISSQQDLYLFYGEKNDLIEGLRFRFSIYKFGYPNDEVLGVHPMTKFGLSWYGLFEVINSPWVAEMRNSNRIHDRHSDGMFGDIRHYIATFKDVTLDVLCRSMEELQLKKEQLFEIVEKEIGHLGNTINTDSDQWLKNA